MNGAWTHLLHCNAACSGVKAPWPSGAMGAFAHAASCFIGIRCCSTVGWKVTIGRGGLLFMHVYCFAGSAENEAIAMRVTAVEEGVIKGIDDRESTAVLRSVQRHICGSLLQSS